MFKVIPIKQQVLVTNNNIPDTISNHPSYMNTAANAVLNNGATVLGTFYPRVRV
jgi:hypothetical protein